MNPEIKAAWLAALRSGEYEQTTGGLHDDVGYCCLGVLCDLHAKATDSAWDTTGGWARYQRETGTLPLTVQIWANLPNEAPDIKGKPISVYNDGRGNITRHTFAEIADLIEDHL